MRSQHPKKKKKAKPTDVKLPDLADGAQRGELAQHAASILMKILYMARMARYDLLRPTCRLACDISKWTEENDKQLHRLICYMHSTAEYCQVGWIGDSPAKLAPHLYADADLAGDQQTHRSTTGCHLALEGPRSRFPLSGVSKRQSCISSSTPEAEIVAGHHGLKSVLMPSMNHWDILLPIGYTAIFTKITRP